MKFVLTSLNYAPELTGIGKYNSELCIELARREIDVNAVVANPYYPEWELHEGYARYRFSRSFENGVKITRCPLYIPNTPSTFKRLFHLISFAITSCLALIREIFGKPDVIFVVQPTLFCAPAVLIIAKITGAKAIMHIQDFEIDALLGLAETKKNDSWYVKFAKNIESRILRKFHAVSSISNKMLDNARKKGVDEGKLFLFPNWSDIGFVTPSSCGSSLKRQWGFKRTDKIVLYAGNIGQKQGLLLVLKAAKKFETSLDVKFVFVGAGSYIKELKENAIKMNLSNVFFYPLLSKEEVPQMLSLAHIHLVIQKRGVADAVLPSKLTNILSSGGHALVTAEKDTELGQLAINFPGIYDCIEPENPSEFFQCLAAMLRRDLSQHNPIARSYAEKYLDKNKVFDKFVRDLEAFCS